MGTTPPEPTQSMFFEAALHSDEELKRMYFVRQCVRAGKGYSDWFDECDFNFTSSRRPLDGAGIYYGGTD